MLLAASGVMAQAQDEASIYVTALKEEQIDEKILESEVFQDCKKKIGEVQDLTSDLGKDAVRECLQSKLGGVSDEQLKEFSSGMQLDSVGFKDTKNAKSLREYLDKRIFEAIHGKGSHDKKKLKEMKFVDQATYLDLYKTQISKNLILDVSRYCLENVGIKDEPGAFVSRLVTDQASTKEANLPENAEKGKKSFDIAFKKLSDGKEASLTLVYQKVADTSGPVWKTIDPVEDNISTLGGKATFWDNIQEYKYCPNVTSSQASDPCHKSRARNQEQIELLKNQELNWAQADSQLIQAKYLTCSTFMIKNMCELYRCNNVYGPGSTSILYNKPAAGICSGFGITLKDASGGVSLENSSGDKRGQIACNMMERIEGYKKTFDSIVEVEKKYNELKRKGTTVSLDTLFKKGQYDRKNIDDITSISSKELVEKVSSYEENKKTAEDLEEKCFQDGKFLYQDEECKALGGELDGEDLAKVQLDTEAETALYLERIKKLKEGGDNEELKEYLIKHGLHDYIPNLEDGSISPDQLVQLISDKYKAERKALINNMNDRFYSLTKKKSDKADDAAATVSDIKKVAEDQVAEIQQHKDRLETLFNYSNIVSSYLQAKDEQGEVSQNTRARQIEIQGLKEHDQDEAQNYEMYFSDSEDSNSDATLSAQGQFIDDILGVGAKE